MVRGLVRKVIGDVSSVVLLIELGEVRGYWLLLVDCRLTSFGGFAFIVLYPVLCSLVLYFRVMLIDPRPFRFFAFFTVV